MPILGREQRQPRCAGRVSQRLIDPTHKIGEGQLLTRWLVFVFLIVNIAIHSFTMSWNHSGRMLMRGYLNLFRTMYFQKEIFMKIKTVGLD